MLKTGDVVINRGSTGNGLPPGMTLVVLGRSLAFGGKYYDAWNLLIWNEETRYWEFETTGPDNGNPRSYMIIEEDVEDMRCYDGSTVNVLPEIRYLLEEEEGGAYLYGFIEDDEEEVAEEVQEEEAGEVSVLQGLGDLQTAGQEPTGQVATDQEV